MLPPQLKPYAKELRQLGATSQHKANKLFAYFGPPGPPLKRPDIIKPDVELPPPRREPQASAFAGMWIDHFMNFGNIRNPI